MNGLSQPKEFPAVFVPYECDGGGSNDDAKNGTLQYWCPYCECVHVHGAAGLGDEPRIEHRGAHCFHGVSPHAGRGINLAVQQSGKSALLYPAALIDLSHRALTPRLRTNLHAQGPAIRRALLKALLQDTSPHRRADKWSVWHGPDLRAFAVEGAGVRSNMAQDLAIVAERIYGVPWEVVARLFLEAAIGRALPAERAMAVEVALRGDDA